MEKCKHCGFIGANNIDRLDGSRYCGNCNIGIPPMIENTKFSEDVKKIIEQRWRNKRAP